MISKLLKFLVFPIIIIILGLLSHYFLKYLLGLVVTGYKPIVNLYIIALAFILRLGLNPVVVRRDGKTHITFVDYVAYSTMLMSLIIFFKETL